jgi:hypothetical protein
LILLQRLVGGAIAVVLFVLALVFASVIFAVVAVLALAAWGWLMWRTRHLPRGAARFRVNIGGRTRSGTGTARSSTGSGTVIEGEYRVEREIRRIDSDTR